MLLAILVLFGNLTAVANDWAPRARPIPSAVSEKQQSIKSVSDGWRPQQNKGRKSPHRVSLRMGHRSSQFIGANKHRVQDPFGDRLARDTAQTRVGFTGQTRNGTTEVNRSPVDQIGKSTFHFVKPGSATPSPSSESNEIRQIKLPFAAPSESPTSATANGNAAAIEESFYTPNEVFSGEITSPLAMAQYEESVLAVSDPSAKPNESKDTKENNRLPMREKVSASGSVNPSERKLPQDSDPPTSVLTVKQVPQSALVPTVETASLVENQESENKKTTEEQHENTESIQTTDDTSPEAAEDLSRPEPPPFESLDLYSDERIIERDSKAMQAEIDAAIAAGKNAYERDCRASREYLLNRTLADISLNISVAGVPGADFPVSCDIETHKIPLNSYRFGQQEPLNFAWTASGLCHKPLYFRELQAERYGHSIGRISQPFLSAAHFFCNVAILPYNMGMRPPQECVYALGHYWPGDPAPRYIPAVPISLRGGLMQAGAVLGAAYVLP